MAIEPGHQLLHYKILEKLGEGGMGVVWKALDTTLDREVAIKVLPEELAHQPQRLARFEREAKVLASLNHSNVAAIFGLHLVTAGDDPAKGTRFLAMELVVGEDLSQRISHGAIPLEEALEITRQIAEGLEAAHRNGIVHRDLKPANVMMTVDGDIKVLDFGLAKALAENDDADSSDGSDSPTMTSAGTIPGMILGTVGYMSPEQARGRPVDRRADIWSLGVILFEMLSGQKMLEGDSIPEVLASLLRGDPDWESLPDGVPHSVRRLLRRCVAKDRRKRFHHAADIRIEIEGILAGEDEGDEPATAAANSEAINRATESAKRRSMLALVAIVVALAALGYAWLGGSRTVDVAPSTVRLMVPATMLDFSAAALPFALSPDGETLAFVDYDGPTTKLFLRRMDSFEVQPVAGTEGASSPFYSPGGDWIGFFASGELKKISTAGGRPESLCATPHASAGGTWLEDDTIIFAMAFTPTGLFRVSAQGGDVEEIAVPAGNDVEYNFRYPSVLPGGQHVLFTIVGTDRMQAAVLSLKDGTHRALSGVGGRAKYLVGGQLVYGDTTALLAAPFDLKTAEVTGPPITALEGVRQFEGGGCFDLSPTGTLVYLPWYEDTFRYVWADRKGNTKPIHFGETGEFSDGSRPVLSNSLSRLTVSGGTTGSTSHFYIHDLERGGRLRVKGLFHTQWTADDSELYSMYREEGRLAISRVPSDGSAEPVIVHAGEHNLVPTGLSPDDKWLLYYEMNSETSRDIWVLRLDGSGEAIPLIVTPKNERAAVFSRDGRYFAYTSDVSGRDEVYVRRFDPTDANVSEFLISTVGGREVIWSRDGSELYYRVGRSLMAVPVQTSGDFVAGVPEKLFDGSWGVETGGLNQMYDVGADGNQFLMVQTTAESNQLNVVLDWAAELDRRK
jgi:Tol biopolymer transport system component